MSPISRRSIDEQRLEAIDAKRRWIAENRDRYVAVKAIPTNLDKMQRLVDNIRDVVAPILEYNPLNEPHVAVHLVARVQAVLEGVFSDLDFISQYEEVLEQLEQLRSTVDSVGDEDR